MNRNSYAKGIDLHIHSRGSNDGVYTINNLMEYAYNSGIGYMSITDHNNLNPIRNFLKEKNYNLKDAQHEVDGMNLIPGVEFTCSINENMGSRGFLKMHLLVYCPDLREDSAISALANIKRANDVACDYGVVVNMARSKGIEIDPEELRQFTIDRRKKYCGFGRFDSKATYTFLKSKKITLAKSWQEFYNLYKKMPQADRMRLDVRDVIQIAHESGGLCIMAHPYVQFKRLEDTDDYMKKRVLNTLLEYEIDGFELYSHSMNRNNFELISSVCKKYAPKNTLIFTGGSDFHTRTKGACSLGKINGSPLDQGKFATTLDVISHIQKVRNKTEFLTDREYSKFSIIDRNKIILNYKKVALEKNVFLNEPYVMD